MQNSVSKIFIAAALGVALALSGTALLSKSHTGVSDATAAQAQALAPTSQPAAQPAPEQTAANQPAAEASGSTTQPSEAQLSAFDQGYRAGYQDGQRDCSTSASVAPASYSGRRHYRRARVAGVRYYAAPRKDHSTRRMILRIAAPAALGAGIGLAAGGGRGAGAGALIGGGAGAIYHLIKH
jgi:hypothetical protein